MRCAFFGRVIGVVILMLSSACTGQEVAGMTPEEAFQDPREVSLVKAAGRGDVKEIEQLVKSGVNVNAAGKRGLTPLIWAMFHLQKESMRKLLEMGADPNQRAETGDTAVWLAAGNEDSELLESLLRAGGDPNVTANTYNALRVAVMQHNFANVKLLVEYGANVNQTGGLPTHTAATTACALAQWEIVAFFLEHGYIHDLQYLARCVEGRVVFRTKEGKDKVKKMLEERGVSFSDLSRERC